MLVLWIQIIAFDWHRRYTLSTTTNDHETIEITKQYQAVTLKRQRATKEQNYALISVSHISWDVKLKHFNVQYFAEVSLSICGDGTSSFTKLTPNTSSLTQENILFP